MNSAFDAALLSRVEDAGLNASAPREQRWIDGWLVRTSPGKAKRARCINALSEGRLPLVQRLAWCEETFVDAGLPMIVRITPFTRPSVLDGVLKSQGLRRFDDTRVMVRPQLGGSLPEPLPAGASIRPLGAEAFARRVGAWRGSKPGEIDAHVQRLLFAPVGFRAFELRLDGVPAACAQFALDLGLAGLYDVFTASDFRGRGLARMLCSHLLGLALAQGARHAYLQVEANNAPARAIYTRLGFIDAYAYHYRTSDPDAA